MGVPANWLSSPRRVGTGVPWRLLTMRRGHALYYTS